MKDVVQIEADTSVTKEDEEAAVGEVQSNLADFKQLYLRWLSPVYRYFYFRTGNVKDAEDLTSQVFLKVYEELPHYHNRGRFPAWLFTIARNKAIDFSHSRPQEEPIEIVDPVDSSLDLLAQAVYFDEIQRLNRLILSLPDDEQELIRLRFVGGLSYREIGEILHRKEDAIRKSISRLLARLQNQLEEYHE